jgi:hypothetical protein
MDYGQVAKILTGLAQVSLDKVTHVMKLGMDIPKQERRVPIT